MNKVVRILNVFVQLFVNLKKDLHVGSAYTIHTVAVYSLTLKRRKPAESSAELGIHLGLPYKLSEHPFKYLTSKRVFERVRNQGYIPTVATRSAIHRALNITSCTDVRLIPILAAFEKVLVYLMSRHVKNSFIDATTMLIIAANPGCDISIITQLEGIEKTAAAAKLLRLQRRGQIKIDKLATVRRFYLDDDVMDIIKHIIDPG